MNAKPEPSFLRFMGTFICFVIGVNGVYFIFKMAPDSIGLITILVIIGPGSLLFLTIREFVRYYKRDKLNSNGRESDGY